jgi:nicotinamide phosphoribosyltransferase
MRECVDNLILDTDSYKASHFLQFPPRTSAMFSYIESRGGRYDHTLFFGLQYILKQYLTTSITMPLVDEAAEFFRAHGEPFPYDGWKHIAARGGALPVRIRAVPEGSLVPTHNVLLTIESTDPEVFWVAGWLETMLVRVWYPITVATQSYYLKRLIWAALEQSADDPAAEIDFKLHDFGSRGVSSRESAQIGGAAHLVNFQGSDTVAGVWCANNFYHSPMAAFSIPAAEHSTITAWGREGESDAYRNIVAQFAKPGSLVACVSDSYDLDYAVRHIWGETLRDEVIRSGATLVIRPDSGDPPTIVTRTLQQLDAHFGSTPNLKGFKVLNHVRVIQGDGVNPESIREILRRALDAGYSASNLTFGMGGALLQQLNRDTQQFAMKCSAVRVGREWRPVSKDPATGPAKRSKAGRLDLARTARSYETVVTADGVPHPQSALVTVFENGRLLVDYTLADIRVRAAQATVD